jgi:hypothetical protein
MIKSMVDKVRVYIDRLKQVEHLSESIAIFAITKVTFLFTRLPLTRPFSFQLSVIAALLLGGYYIFLKKSSKSITSRYLPYLIIFLIMSLIGTTGWVLSPFFYLLYISCIGGFFVLPKRAAWVFVLTVLSILTVSIGTIDIYYDSLVAISFASVVPLSLYLIKAKDVKS